MSKMLKIKMMVKKTPTLDRRRRVKDDGSDIDGGGSNDGSGEFKIDCRTSSSLQTRAHIVRSSSEYHLVSDLKYLSKSF